jgi:hypothetical protein
VYEGQDKMTKTNRKHVRYKHKTSIFITFQSSVYERNQNFNINGN